MSPSSVFFEVGSQSARSRRVTELTGLLAMMFLSGCVDGRTFFEAFAALAIIGLVVKLPWLCLAYGLATGGWIAIVGTYRIIQSGILSGGSCQVDISIPALTPFVVVTEGISAFCLLYAGLLALGVPWGGCGAWLAIATVVTVFLELETFGSLHFLGTGWLLGVLLVGMHVTIGQAVAKSMLAALNNPERRMPLNARS